MVPLFFFRLADRDLWNSHEGRAAQDAQTILDDGRWGLPRLYDGQIELQKPPLYYWLVAMTAWCRGGTVDAWAVRLPSAASAAGCVVLVYLLGAWRGRRLAGFLAALVLATALHFTWIARVGRIDMPLTLAVALTVAGCSLGRTATGWTRLAWLLTAYLAVAAAVLLKGPIGVVLPASILGMHLLLEGVWTRPRLGLWWGVPLVLAVSLPWFVWANAVTDGELARVFLWRHNIARGFDEAGGLRSHPWWFYGPQLLIDFLPWSPALLLAGWCYLRRPEWRSDSLARFGIVWLLATVFVLSCVRFKRADYLLPAYPGAALFLGCAVERWLCSTRYARLVAGGFAAVVAACVVGWLVYVEVVLPQAEPGREYKRFAAAIREQAPQPQPIVFFRTESHALAFHVGRPIVLLVEWPDLQRWADANDGCVVMPRRVADELPRELPGVELRETLNNGSLAGGWHEKPLILLRAGPTAVMPRESSDARPSSAAADRD